MLPKSIEELNRVRDDCHGMVTQRAGLSGGAALVPIPGVDIAADVGLLLQLLPDINRRFGLAPEQINQYDAQTKMIIANLIIQLGTKIAGQLITKTIIMQLLRLVGIRMTAKQVIKYIPFFGQAAAAALSFAAMKFVGDQHVSECYDLAKRIIENGPNGDNPSTA